MAGMSDADVQGQIAHMIAFIDQEASEKVEEIGMKAEEEFNIEKGRLVQQARVKIIDHYDRKTKQVELQKKIQMSNMQNNARLQILRKKEEYFKDLIEDARKQLMKLHLDNPEKYKELLLNLILQALVRLIEPTVNVRCRREDVQMIKNSIPDLCRRYKELMKGKYEVSLTVDEESFLSSDICGGVELSAKQGKITIVNTIDERLKLVSNKMTPKVREQLFGANPNRRFKD